MAIQPVTISHDVGSTVRSITGVSARRRDPRGGEGDGPRVVRGGSYLCHASYCNRYRVDARSANSPDASTGNTGFRVARDRP